MRVALYSPWDNAWVPYYKRAFEARGHTLTHCKKDSGEMFDLALHMWATGETPMWRAAKNYVFMRRYELFSGGLDKVDWDRADGLICVNSWIKKVCEDVLKRKGKNTPVHLIYNGTDTNRWTFKERKHGKRIGMACHVHPKKNLPLALQILASLPQDYTLHIAGEIQDPCTAEYLNEIGERVQRKVYLYGHVKELNLWWEGMNYCLSTSLSEGNPNNVIEAMAKGIKPVVHGWPGAADQFAPLFYTVDEAVEQITSPYYDSQEYRRTVEEKFSLANVERAVSLTTE